MPDTVQEHVVSIHGDIVLPSLRATDRGNISASAWVQIDGDSCDTAALMAGIDMTLVGSNTTIYEGVPCVNMFSSSMADLSLSSVVGGIPITGQGGPLVQFYM